MSNDPAPTSPEFLQFRLTELLSAPHISFPKHPPGGPFGALRMGHGPVDLFSTRFLNDFAEDARGTVNGRAVDTDGLKAALLALQRRWNPDTSSFTPVVGAQGGKPTTRFAWTQREGTPAEVTAAAEVAEEGGLPRIHHLTLDGDASLFEPHA